MTSNIFDFAVIGGGAAGVSAAYELSQHGRVALLERESAVGYHSTGRSAAVMVESYGPTSWQILATPNRPFFEDPPEGVSDHALLRQLGALFLARPDQEDEMEDAARELSRRSVAHEIMPAGSAKELCPVVRLDGFSRALYEPNCADI